MGRIKKLDTEGMLGRVDTEKLGVGKWIDFTEADKNLVEIDRLLSECGVEGISSVGYISHGNEIGMLQEDCELLKEYPKNLVEEMPPIDEEFFHNVTNALDALSAIRIEDIKVRNTFDVKITQHFDKDDLHYSENHIYEFPIIKQDLTIPDFMGYYKQVVYNGENSFVEGFTDVIYSNGLKEGKDLQAIAKENEELLNNLLYGSEFEMKKYQPLVELNSSLFSATMCGTYSLETALLGYDTITKERLTEGEKALRGITGTISLATLLMGWGQAGGAAEGIVIYMSMAGANSAQVLTEYGCEQLEAPPLVTAIISTTVGMGVGALSFKVGNKYAKPYDAGNSGVFDGVDKEAAFPKNKHINEGNETGFQFDKTAYHSIGGENANKNVQSVLNGIDISYTDADSRFGRGFYVSADGKTSLAELEYHGKHAIYSIRYDMDLSGEAVLDLTNPIIAKEWGFAPRLSTIPECQMIAEKAVDEGYTVIKVLSYRDDGINYILYDNFSKILKPQIVIPVGE